MHLASKRKAARCGRFRWPLTFVLFAITTALLACQVPVFRYALERWQADRYRVVVIHDQALSESHQAAISALEAAMHDEETLVNIELREVDVREDLEPAWKQFAKDQFKGGEPVLYLLYPFGAYNDRPLWQGAL